jgi:hypothetical protein
VRKATNNLSDGQLPDKDNDSGTATHEREVLKNGPRRSVVRDRILFITLFNNDFSTAYFYRLNDGLVVTDELVRLCFISKVLYKNLRAAIAQSV